TSSPHRGHRRRAEPQPLLRPDDDAARLHLPELQVPVPPGGGLHRPGLRRRSHPRAPRGTALRRGQDPGHGPRTERKRMTSQTDFDLSVTMTDDAPPQPGRSDGHAIETTDLDTSEEHMSELQARE